jgi:tetratricopeptide (TPR) repeat protein
MRAAIIFGDFAKSTVIAAVFLGCACGTQARAVTATQPADCWTLQRNGRRVEAQACFESLVRSTSAYLRAEGYWGTAQYTEANDEFRLATAPAGSNPDYRVRWGMLLHERFNNAEAVDLFSEALQKDPRQCRGLPGTG